MPPFPKPLIVAASGIASVLIIYFLVAAWLDFFPFAAPTSDEAGSFEPLATGPTPDPNPNNEDTSQTEVPESPTTDPTPTNTPITPPTSDPGSGAGGAGQPTSVPIGSGGATPESPDTPTAVVVTPTATSVPSGGGGNQPTAVPTAVPTQVPPGGGGGGGPPITDDDDDGAGSPNQSPEAVADNARVDEGDSVVVNVLTNDSDFESDPLTVTGVTQGSNGLVTFSASSLTYTHNGTPTTSDSFNYFISDSAGGAATATVTITINNVDDPPVARDDAVSTDEEVSLNGNVLVDNGNGADSDEEGDPLSVSATPVSSPSDGTLTLNPDGTFTYDPNLNFNGADSFVYLLETSGGNDQGTVTITVNPVNDPPVAQDDDFTSEEDVAINGDLLADNGNGLDSDIDGDTLGINTVPVSGPSNGSLTLNSNGTFTYTPNAEFSGADAFQYELDDGKGGNDTGDVRITINNVDDPPVAVDDAATVNEDSSNNLILVLANDTDVDGGSLSIGTFTNPGNGSVRLVNAGANFSYTPDANYCNDGITTDDFTYTLTPGSSTATVRVTVTCLPDPPVAGTDTYDSVGNTVLQVGVTGISPSVQITGSVLDNDTNPDGIGPLSVTGTSSVSAGASVAMNPDGTFTYTPPVGANSVDSFVYTASDGANSANGTVNINLSNRVWFIDNSAAAAGDGRSSSPFQSLAAFNVVNGNPPAGSNPAAGDTIFIAQGSGDYPGGIVLLDNQKLIGNGVELVEGPLTIPASGSPTLSAGIVIADDNTIRGLDITATTNDGIEGNNAGGNTLVDQVNVFLSGAGNGIDLNNQSGTFTFSNSSITYSGSAAAVDINGGTATVDFESTTAITATDGTGLQFNNADGIYTFDGSVTLDGGDAGIDIMGGSAGTFTLADATVTNPSGFGVYMDGNSANVNYNGGSITQTNAVSAIAIDDLSAGTINFDVPVTASTSTAIGISIANNTGPTINFNGNLDIDTTTGTGFNATGAGSVNVTGSNNTINAINGTALNVSGTNSPLGMTYHSISSNASGASGISLTNNTGTFTFTDVSITNSGQTGFNADSSGTVIVTGANNAINTTNGTGLNLSNTTIGNGGITFQSLSSSNTDNGIVLNNAGTNGFTITGVGSTDGSGGTIQNITQRGIEVLNTGGVSLSNLTLNNANTTDTANTANCNNLGVNTSCNAAIHLFSVNGVTLTNIDISGTTTQNAINGNTVSGFNLVNSTAANCGNEVNEGCLRLINLTGDANITGSTLSFGAERNAQIENSSGSLNLTISNSTFSDTQSSGFGADGLEFLINGTASATVDVQNSNFLRNATNGVQLLCQGSAVCGIDVTGSTFDRETGVGIGLDLSASDTAQLTLNVINNPMINSRGGPAINSFADNNAVVRGRINNNSDIQVGGPGTSGSGIRVNANENADMVFEIDGNTVSNIGFDIGIDAVARGLAGGACGTGCTAGRLDVTINNNNVTLADALGLYDIRVQAQESNTICGNVTSNTASTVGISSFRERTSAANSTVLLQSFSSNATTTWNNNGNTPAGSVSESNNGTLADGTCRTVSHPLP